MPNYADGKKRRIVEKYKHDDLYRRTVIVGSIMKYAENEQHKSKVKSASMNKYSRNADFRRKTILYNVNKYKCNENYRQQIKEENKARALRKKAAMRNFSNAKVAFEEEISHGSVCCRRLFLKQVIECRRGVYEK